MPEHEHRNLCTIELIAKGHAERCPGERCAFWDDGCVLVRVVSELDARPEVAELLLDLRQKLEAGEAIPVEDASAELRRRLGSGG